MKASSATKTHDCAHCGDPCPNTDHSLNEDSGQYFCCNGCMMVYDLLHSHELGDYYRFESTPGISPDTDQGEYDFLEDETIVKQLLDFSEDNIQKITLHLPQIHCSSCLYLLEHLNKLDKGVIQSKVNFTTKKASIIFNSEVTSLKAVVGLLSKIGYEPRLNLDSLNPNQESKLDKKLLYKLGLAGFSFGNIMLLSFPEYLGFDKASYLWHIGYINILLATPLLFYSGWDYIKSAWQGLKMKHLNIDIPIALGMVTLYTRSVFEIVSHQGEGYLDSFAGFVFFLLIGKWFQSYTYQVLDFERNYKSYFPISALINRGGKWVSTALHNIRVGDLLLLKNQQLIPADGIITRGKARVDYSFVTGESELIAKKIGENVYAGGRHQGANIEISITKAVDQSYLTQLWNEDTFTQAKDSNTSKLIALISKYFTLAILTIAFITLIAWSQIDSSRMIYVFTAVLIVACPCALALAIPFTYGNIVRILSEHGLYLKNTQTIEHVQDVTHIIFDKTGTITDNNNVMISYEGSHQLTREEKVIIRSVCHHSTHPLSIAINEHLSEFAVVDIDSYQENIGLGISAQCLGRKIRLGSSAFIFGTDAIKKEKGVFIEIDGSYRGHYIFRHALREGIQDIVAHLRNDYQLMVLSGDNDKEYHRMQDLFGKDTALYFNQSPSDKLNKVKSLQNDGAVVMMIGDGLNDAGALHQSDVGLVISDKINNFSPACDGILDAQHFDQLYAQLSYLTQSKWIIYGAFALAFAYNAIGLSFAIYGQLSPVIAAILMPLSSISVILYGVSASYLYYRWKMKNKSHGS